MQKRILIVDDDPIIRKGLQVNLEAQGFKVVEAGNATEAIHATQQQRPDLMILDLSLVNDGAFNGLTDGFSMLHWLRYSMDDVRFPVVIYTSDESPSVDRRAVACQAYAVVRKGENVDHLIELVRRALAEREARQLGQET